MNRTMVRHGETGFLATTPDEWADAIELLANDPAPASPHGRGRPTVRRAALQCRALGE